MNYLKKAWQIFNNYLIARLLNRPSTALFWYLPEPVNIASILDLEHYPTTFQAPLYLIDYRQKLKYTLQNEHGIIVLAYQGHIGNQINPEAAFQYALGLHDEYCLTDDPYFYKKFMHYAYYFLNYQSQEGLWGYQFDWYAAKAPWYSALAQSRGASVMLRAWLLSKEQKFLDAALKALHLFNQPIHAGGFLHFFKPTQSAYFEEYPHMPTGVINGFMASLMSIWELKVCLKEKWIHDLWNLGIDSLHSMLPYYSNGWWSLYDLDIDSPIPNVNSPRYHLLEINYLRILSILSDSKILKDEAIKRTVQYNKLFYRSKALCLKSIRKILYK